jgi:hypothetical protein
MSEEPIAVFFWVAVVGFAFWWGKEPAYIENVKADSKSEWGEPYVLSKMGSGQVAVFHGFADDYSVCDMARQRIEAEGGVYVCSPSSEVLGKKPWWKLW